MTTTRPQPSACLVAAVALASLTAAAGAQQPTREVGGGYPEVESILASAGPISVREVTAGLDHPWGLAFLPDGRALVTERPGTLRIVSGFGDDAPLTVSDPVQGVPEVFARGQGGLMDVAVDPDFEDNAYVYLSYAKPGAKPGRDGKATTALGRGKLVDGRVDGFEDVFVQEPYVDGPNHFGNRIVFAPDGKLFLLLGERFKFDPAQDLGNHLGKVIRINPDGSVPEDNPFVGREGARPEIWSYGHRNIEAAAIRPATGELWHAEMGPLGGDELNRPEAGKNYGWPVVSWGVNYDGSAIPEPPTRPDFADAVAHWSPVISPSGMIFYTGEVFEPWRGSMFIGGLSCHDLVRVELNEQGTEVAEREDLPLGSRIREVEQGPDGLIYVLVDKAAPGGALWRLEPLRP